MRNLIFWGATGQAKVLREALADTDFRLVALFDNRLIPSPFPQVPLHVGVAGFEKWKDTRPDLSCIHFCVAIGGGYGRDRMTIYDRLMSEGLKPVTVVHRSAFVANDALLRDGCQVLARSVVCTHVHLGHCVIVNTSASIDHDCEIGDGVHIGPGAILAGEVCVGSRSFVGAGAVILPRVVIGDDVIIGAGAVVTKDISNGMTVVGVPARCQDPLKL